METNSSRRAIIAQRKNDLKKRYGSNPVIYSSGQKTNAEEFPMKMKINLDAKVIDEYLSKPK